MRTTVPLDNSKPLHGQRFHFRRPRVDRLLKKAVNSPLVFVTAGAGYGKTQAVLDFLNSNDIVFSWLHLSKLDNLTTRFWESFLNAAAVHDLKFLSQLFISGFPHSMILFNNFLSKLQGMIASMDRFVLVFDNFHLINESAIISFIENLLYARINNLTVIIISRAKPKLSIKGLFTDELLFQITEKDLCFTTEETRNYLKAQDIELSDDGLEKIQTKTEGWISSIYLIGLSLKKEKKIDLALAKSKQPIFELIEQEIFSEYTPEIQKSLIKLSLMEKIPFDIVLDYLNNNINLAKDLEMNNMFIRFDSLTASLQIHALFREFLSRWQFTLTKEEFMETHRKIADWFNVNDSKIDALEHYQECGSFDRIWDIISGYDIAIPSDTAEFFIRLIESFPIEFVERHPLVPVVHARLLLNNGRIAECMSEFTSIINKYEKLPPTAESRAVIGEACLFMGMVSLLSYDYKFVGLFKKADEFLPNGSSLIDNRLGFSEGAFMVTIKEPSHGELDRLLDAVNEAMPYASRAMNGCAYGIEYITKAEAHYYRGNMNETRINAHKAILMAEQKQQYDTVCAAYFFIIKAYISMGNYSEAVVCLEQLTKKIEGAPSENYVYIKNCFYTMDILTGWFYSRVGDSKKIPRWVLGEAEKQRGLSPNNYRDQFIRAYFLLNAKRYQELSALMDTLEAHYECNGLLPARLKVQIYKAIAAHKNKNAELSMAALQKAYYLAHANSLTMPFIELGKDMRALIYNALRYNDIAVPEKWLKGLYTKSSTYAKQLKSVQEQYKLLYELKDENSYELTKLEKEVLKHICTGLTRKEIADNLYVSTSSIKQALSSIYNKLGVENRSEAIRVAVKSGLDK